MSYPPSPPPPDSGDPNQPSGSPPPGYGNVPPGPPGAPAPGAPGSPGGGYDAGWGGGYGYPPPPVYGPAKSSGKAVAALAIGIASTVLGLCCAFVGLVGIVAIVLGRSARQEIQMSGGRLTGTGMAQAGVVLGIVGCVLGVLMTVVNVMLISTGTFEFNSAP